MQKLTCPSLTYEIYIAGSLETIKQACQAFVYRNPKCVTVEPCYYVYEGGCQEGARVGLRAYPRFPEEAKDLAEYAEALANNLVVTLHQHSAMIQGPEETVWISWSSKP